MLFRLATCGIEVSKVIEYMPIVNEAIEMSDKNPVSVVVLERPQAQFEPVEGRDVIWSDLMANAQPIDCVPVSATHPLYILYTSGDYYLHTTTATITTTTTITNYFFYYPSHYSRSQLHRHSHSQHRRCDS